MRKEKYLIGFTVIFGLVGGLLFHLLHLPIPWILGSAAAAIVMNCIRPQLASWPNVGGHAGIVMIAYMLGSSLTPEMSGTIVRHLPWMIAAGFAWVAFCYVLGLVFSKAARLDPATGIIGCMPGGLAQMVLIAEETKNADSGTVALIQTARLIFVLYSVPFLARIFSADGTVALGMMTGSGLTEYVGSWPLWLGYVLVPLAPLSAWIAKKCRMPAGEFAGPAIVIGGLSIAGCQFPPLPYVLICAAQIAIGLFIGKRVEPRLFIKNRILGPLEVGSALLLVIFTIIVAWLLSLVSSNSTVTWFLALAPGGLSEMATTALIIGADVAIVSSYQMFRVFFIVLAAAPFLRKNFKASDRTATASQEVV